MNFKGEFRQKYTVDREAKELVVEVELKQRDGLVPAGQNIYYGVAKVNGQERDHKDLPYCVHAQYMAEQIGEEIIAAWKKRAKEQGNSFRLKRK